MKFYIAGASAEIDLCERMIAAVREMGHTITFDWCAHIRAVGAANRDVSDTVQLASAKADLDAVQACDVLWLLVPSTASSGAWIEFGYALARRRITPLAPLIFLSGDHERSIFSTLATRRFATHDEALEFIRKGTR